MDPVVSLEVAALSRLRAVTDAISKGDSPIQQSLDGATVFVTGASGFLGKHLVEKLLRSTKARKIYLLLRSKKGKTVTERLNAILEDTVFEDLRKQESSFGSRVAAISGDITELQLGLSNDHYALLAKEVSFIYHVAATTRFDEPLSTATLTNVRGTREVITLARNCRKLKALVHVSTAFSHATSSRFNAPVTEQYYSVPIDPKQLIHMAETMNDQKLADVTYMMSQDWPNTYCFTKACAEEVVRTMSDGLPVCIVRPSIVICSYLEPAPGWVDMSCTYGPAGVMVGIGLGLVHVMFADDAINIDFVPADYVNNAVLAAGWATTKQNVNDEKMIYAVSNNRNPTSWGACAAIHRTDSRSICSPFAVWYCFCTATSSRFIFTLLFWLLHYIPAYVLDAICVILGRKRQFVKLYTKAYKLFTLTSYFTTHEWQFSDRNLMSLYQTMDSTDKQIYNFDIKTLDWKELMLVWCMGLRKYIVKDGLKDTEYAVKKQLYFRIANYIVLTLYAYFWYKLFSYVFTGVMYLF